MRSIAVADEPPPLPPPVHDPEPDQEVEAAEAAQEEPDAPPDGAPAALTLVPVPETEPEGRPEPAAVDGATEDDLPAVGEDTSEVAVVSEPESRPAAAQAPAPVAVPRRPERERPARKAPRERSLLPRLLAAAALVVGLAAVGAYFLLSGGGSSKPPGGQFQTAGAPVNFSYPSDLVPRQPPRGGLLKPTFSTAVGVNAANYVVVATYKISADVQSDGSAIGTGGSRLTADRFDESVDRAAERIAAAQKLKANGPVEPGKAGDLIARVYSYTRPNGSSARYAFAFRGHTEYSIACFWDPAHATQLSAACDQVMTSLQRV
jgi:hypothetical protein